MSTKKAKTKTKTKKIRLFVKNLFSKKITPFIFLVAVAIGGYISILVSSIGGYFLAKKVSGKKEGERGIFGSLKLKIGNYYLHLHHWLISTFLLINPYFWKIIPPSLNQVALGTLLGVAWQGIFCYQDWHQILKRE